MSSSSVGEKEPSWCGPVEDTRASPTRSEYNCKQPSLIIVEWHKQSTIVATENDKVSNPNSNIPLSKSENEKYEPRKQGEYDGST